MKKLICCMMVMMVGFAFGHLTSQAQTKEAAPMLRAAIFVQNRAQPELNEKIGTLRDFISNRLAAKGFSILDHNEVVARLQDQESESSEVQQAISAMVKIAESDGSDSAVDDVLDSASALRIAQMIGADYMIIASITSLGQESRSFSGTGRLAGINTQMTEYYLRLGLKVMEANEGGSVYGDVISASKKIPTLANLKIEDSDLINKLMDDGSMKIAENIGKKIEAIRTVKVNTIPMVEFTVKVNVPGATVALDDVAIGSAPGTFLAKPGLHTISVSKEWHASWKRTANIVQGQVFDVALELSNEGMAKKAEIERLNREDELTRKQVDAQIDIAREQSKADAESKKAIAEGQSEFLKNSHMKVDADIEGLNLGGGAKDTKVIVIGE